MKWESITSIISVLANAATAVGLWLIFRQVRNEVKQRKKEANQAVWDLLAAEDVYTARLLLEYHEAPVDYDAAMKGDSPWIRAALKCFLAYQKAAYLVLRHKWMQPEQFAEQWGYSTLIVWTRLQPWIYWYREARSYPGFGRSVEDLVALVRRFDEGKVLQFKKESIAAPDRRASSVLYVVPASENKASGEGPEIPAPQH